MICWCLLVLGIAVALYEFEVGALRDSFLFGVLRILIVWFRIVVWVC